LKFFQIAIYKRINFNKHLIITTSNCFIFKLLIIAFALIDYHLFAIIAFIYINVIHNNIIRLEADCWKRVRAVNLYLYSLLLCNLVYLQHFDLHSDDLRTAELYL